MRGREKGSDDGCVMLCLRERDRKRKREEGESIIVGFHVTFAGMNISWDTCEFAHALVADMQQCIHSSTYIRPCHAPHCNM